MSGSLAEGSVPALLPFGLGRPLINQEPLLEGVVWVFYAGEEILDIGCKSEVLRKENIGTRLKSLGLALAVG